MLNATVTRTITTITTTITPKHLTKIVHQIISPKREKRFTKIECEESPPKKPLPRTSNKPHNNKE